MNNALRGLHGIIEWNYATLRDDMCSPTGLTRAETRHAMCPNTYATELDLCYDRSINSTGRPTGSAPIV